MRDYQVEELAGEVARLTVEREAILTELSLARGWVALLARELEETRAELDRHRPRPS